jgi:mRNA interferase MazF
MSLTKGDVVLVPFPFTNLSQTKLRPAVILWVDPQGRDITLCFVSSKNINQTTNDEILITPNDPEFSKTGLKVASKIKVARLVTLERQFIQRRLGKLGKQQLNLLNQTLIRTFKINL